MKGLSNFSVCIDDFVNKLYIRNAFIFDDNDYIIGQLID
jgi:hypothetical protein